MNINDTVASSAVSEKELAAAKSDDSFNQKVLDYIQQNRPEIALSELLPKIKALAPDKILQAHQLSEALTYSDTYLRLTPGFEDYTKHILDKRASQMVGVEMLFNDMLNVCFNRLDSDLEPGPFL